MMSVSFHQCPGYAKIEHGVYTGDGSRDQYIQGIGFRPVYIEILIYTDSDYAQIESYLSLPDMFSNNTRIDSPAVHHSINRDVWAGEDGFHVDDMGTNAAPNASGVVYIYVCIGPVAS